TTRIPNGLSEDSASSVAAAVSYRKSTTSVQDARSTIAAPAVPLKPVRYRTFGRCVTTRPSRFNAPRSDCNVAMRLRDVDTAGEVMNCSAASAGVGPLRARANDGFQKLFEARQRGVDWPRVCDVVFSWSGH